MVSVLFVLFLVPAALCWFDQAPPVTSQETQWPQLHECLCQVSGSLGDCSCDVESVDSYNTRFIYPQLRELTFRDYFKYFKVNLHKDCKLWPDDSRCVLEDCAVQICTVDSLPSSLQSADCDTANTPGAKTDPDANAGRSDPTISGSPDVETEAKALGSVDSTITDEMLKEFPSWESYDEMESKDFCVLEDEHDPHAEYVDLTLNPERYTGYAGESPRRIWRSVYQENCFHADNADILKKDLSSILTSYSMNSVCVEKRVFYRLISGLHASINVHLSAKYLIKGPFGQIHFAPNLTEFRVRFDPEFEREGPQRLKNIYFLYLVEMRAILKAKDFLQSLDFFTNISSNDEETKKMVDSLLEKVTEFPHHFDENTLFKQKEVQSLKQVYKSQFRNISKIMDCVGCEKCRLWGKVQTQGLGTALKILFSEHSIELNRPEIVTLINAFAQLSESIWHIQEFRELSSKHSEPPPHTLNTEL